jgi:hypothetical protein
VKLVSRNNRSLPQNDYTLTLSRNMSIHESRSIPKPCCLRARCRGAVLVMGVLRRLSLRASMRVEVANAVALLSVGRDAGYRRQGETFRCSSTRPTRHAQRGSLVDYSRARPSHVGRRVRNKSVAGAHPRSYREHSDLAAPSGKSGGGGGQNVT